MIISSVLATCALCVYLLPGPAQATNKTGQDPINPVPTLKPAPDHALLKLGTAHFRQGSPVTALVGSPDGKFVASAGDDGSVWLWDAPSGKLRKRLHPGPGKVTALAFAPDSKHVAFAWLVPGAIAEVQIQNVAGNVSSIIPARVDVGYPLAIANDGKTIALGDGNKVRLTTAMLESAGGDAPGPRYLDCEQQALSLHFSDDGKHLNVAVSNGIVQQWTATGDKVQTWGKGNLPAELVNQFMAYCPANKHFAARAQLNEFQLWDVPGSKASPAVLKASIDFLTAADFSPDGKHFAAVGYSEDMEKPNTAEKNKAAIFLWDAATGKLRHEVGTNLPLAKSLAFAGDGMTLFTGHVDGIIRAWDLQTGKEIIQKSLGHQDKVTAVVYTPDSKYLLSAGDDKTIRKWEVPTGKLLWTVPTGSVVTSLVIAPDGKRFATAGADKSIRLWQTADGKEVQKLDGLKQAVTDLAFSPDGNYLASWGRDSTLRLWLAASGKKVYELKDVDPNDIIIAPPVGADPPESLEVKGLAFTPDGKYLFTGSAAGIIKMRLTATGKAIRTISYPDSILALAVSPDGRNLIVSRQFGGTWLIEIATGQPRLQMFSSLNSYQSPFGAPGFSIGGGSGGFTGSGKTGGCSAGGFGGNGSFGAGGGIAGFNGFNGFGPGSGFGSFGSGFTIGVDGFAGTINFGNPYNSMFFLPHKPGHIGPVLALAYSPKGKYLATASQDRTILLWNGVSSKVLSQVGEHQGAVTAVAFAPDGKTLASASADTTIIIWDMAKVLAQKVDPIEKGWDDLGNPHAATAFQALQDLAETPDKTLSLLQKKLQPVKLSSKQIQKWLTDLGSGHFPTRETASKELEKIAEIIEPVLRETLAKPPSVEIHLRVKLLLDKLPQETPSATGLQQLHALELLMDNPKARQLLQTLALGTPEAWLTQEAQKILKRLTE